MPEDSALEMAKAVLNFDGIERKTVVVEIAGDEFFGVVQDCSTRLVR
jgi:hypothetical protein